MFKQSQARIAAILLITTFLTGCLGLGSKVDETDSEPHLYIVDVDRGAVAPKFAKGRVLLIKPIRVTPHFRSKSIVFRVGENEYQPQASHYLFSKPEEMFTEQLKRWLEKSGQFTKVITDPSLPADLVLETAITKLYGDGRQQFSPQAVLTMQFFLTKNEGEKSEALFQTGLESVVDIEKTTAANVVKGWTQGLEELLATLEDDLRGYFSKRSP